MTNKNAHVYDSETDDLDALVLDGSVTSMVSLSTFSIFFTFFRNASLLAAINQSSRFDAVNASVVQVNLKIQSIKAVSAKH